VSVVALLLCLLRSVSPRHCVTVSLFHRVTVSLFHCVTVSLVTAPLHHVHCVTVSLRHCLTVSLGHCLTVPLRHCAPASLGSVIRSGTALGNPIRNVEAISISQQAQAIGLGARFLCQFLVGEEPLSTVVRS